MHWPYTSTKTLEFHHDKHHAAYVTNLNNLLKDSPMASQSLEDVTKATAKDDSKAGIFNNTAQVWNHTFFWKCTKPNGGGQPSGNVAAAMTKSFGSYEKFKEEFKAACVSQFGSLGVADRGWRDSEDQQDAKRR